MQHISVFTGAGISAESGLNTFRADNGLWKNYPIEDIATFEGFIRNPDCVLQFYNERRTELAKVLPNAAHISLAQLEETYEVDIITQNIDNLHERAGSSKVLHLHGELTKAQSSNNEKEIIDIQYNNIGLGETASDGSQLRPYVVWFGEEVLFMQQAYEIVSKTDMLIVIGTSLQVQPAASLLYYVQETVPIVVIDIQKPSYKDSKQIQFIHNIASVAVPKLVKMLLDNQEIYIDTIYI